MYKTAFFTEEEILKLKNTTNPELRKLVDTLAERSAKALENGGGDFITLGFGYYYTGNKEFIDLARKEFKNQLENGLWISDEYDATKYNGYDIRTALETERKVNTLSAGIALFGDLVSEDELKYYAEETYVRGILPIMEDWVLQGKRMHALDTMGHNFWIVITSAVAAALTIMKDIVPDGEYLLKEAIKAVKSWFEYEGNPMNAKQTNFDNGAYHEGVTYFDYSYNTYLTFANIYRNITGEHPFDDVKYLEKGLKFILNSWFPSDNKTKDYYIGFGDCEQPHCSLNAPLSLVRYGIDDAELRYYLNNRNLKKYDLQKALTWDELYGKETKKPETKSVLYDKVGWAMFRDGYDEDSVMLAIKCGDTWNHAHADCCHFNLYRNRRPEIFDTLQARSYSSEAYHEYYVESIGHNVLLFNDKGQDFRDNYKNHTHLKGQFYNFIDDDGFRYVVADGTGPMGRYFRKHHRHFLWLDGFIIIYDDVECYECGKVSFLLHAKENNTFKMLSPATVETRRGYIDGEFKEKNCTYTVYNSSTDDEGHAKFLGTILLDESKKVEFEDLTDAWKVTCGDTVVYVNRRADGKIAHRNCINIIDGYVTDAEILVKQKDRYAVANASIVRKDDENILEVFARVNGWTDKIKD
ncbi:MAG: heparinase II/III family protein [Clostridia bacterium]|nr:heparinase II/III family protein [Clostridia bacterium]